MKIIPAIDIMNGTCVRLRQGNFADRTEYSNNPLQVALELEKQGVEFLHVVDLDAARSQRLVNLDLVEKICASTSLQVDYGGGISNLAQAETILKKGITALNIGSLAVKNPQELLKILEVFGAERVILSVDIRKNKVAINGWQTETDIDLFEFLETQVQFGITQVCCTDIDRDGMLSGPAISTYKKIKLRFPQLELIASGGVSSTKDIRELEEIKVDGVIIGKALYEGKLKLEEILC